MKKIEPQNMGEVVLYQPDERTQLEVRLEDETVWLTQQQMSELFDVKEHTITYHIKEIYKSQELDAISTARKIRVVRKEGNRQVNRQLDFYNLDMILSVGYRVNSVRGIMFRRWSSDVLKQYLLRGYAVHEQIQQLENRIDNRFVSLQQYTDQQIYAVQQQISDHQQQIDFLVHTHQQPTYQLYDNGCVFDAWAYVSDLVRNAEANRWRLLHHTYPLYRAVQDRFGEAQRAISCNTVRPVTPAQA